MFLNNTIVNKMSRSDYKSVSWKKKNDGKDQASWGFQGLNK